MEKVLVTGATGFLGNNIARMLIDDGLEVVVTTRASSGPRPFEGLNLTIIEMDLEDDVAIRHALRGVDTVIHSAGLIWFGFSKLEESRRVNVEITRKLASACQEAGIRFVYISSVDALPASDGKQVLDEDSTGVAKPPCNYVVSKSEADQMLKEMSANGLDLVISYPTMMLGPWDWKPSSSQLIIEIARLGKWFVCPTGGVTVGDVRDVARCVISAASNAKSGSRYIMGGPHMRYRQLCNLIAEACGVPKPRLRSGPVAILVSWIVEWFNRLRGKETIINSGAVAMARMFHYYSSKRAETELGLSNRPLETTLKDSISWLRSQEMLPK